MPIKKELKNEHNLNKNLLNIWKNKIWGELPFKRQGDRSPNFSFSWGISLLEVLILGMGDSFSEDKNESLFPLL